MQERTVRFSIRRASAAVFIAAAAGGIWLLTTGAEPHRRVSAAAQVPARAASAGSASAPTDKIVFNRDIRPILADRCFACHGPDGNKRQAGLRLDRPQDAMGALPQHPALRAFVPGDPERSEALRRILSKDAAVVMPPATSHLKLDEKEKELIRRWVAQGGDYLEHWAFTKPARPEPPAVQDKSWVKNDIDRFVLANLEARGMQPSRPADKATLIRRASLDLTGIPPTPAEVDAFVADSSPDAFAKVVERLLASPRYGEHMAVQWLDYARYADSHGYQSDPERFMSLWRDWVIKAYNANMPFDQFTIEQIAGDLLPDATVDQKIATGFNRNHRLNNEGGIIAEEWRIEGVVDRVATTSAVFLGLTLECCRCHDHKYDPITQKEFFAFSGYFNSINETGMGDLGPTDRGANVAPILKVPSPAQKEELAALDGRIEAIKAKQKELGATVAERAAKLDKASFKPAEPEGLVARFPLDGKAKAAKASGEDLATEFAGKADAAFVAGKYGQAQHFDGKGAVVDTTGAIEFDKENSFSYGVWVKREGSGEILSRMDNRSKYRGFDLFVAGDKLAVHIIHEWEENAIMVRTTDKFPAGVWTHAFATYDGSGKASGIKIYLDGVSKPLETVQDKLKDTIKTPSKFRIGGRDGGDSFTGDVQDVRVYSRALSGIEVAALARGRAVQEILDVPAEKRTPEQGKELAAYIEATTPEFIAASEELTKVTRERAALDKKIPDTMVMADLPKPRDTFVLVRGEYDKRGEKVDPGVPAVLPPLPKDAPPNRLGLARWMIDPANPLTPRVQANRLWESFFGVGLVKTSENLGVQTEWPSHPDLLDWLASEMLRLKWDVKAFQRQIVLSATYQQASEIPPALLELDPENRLLARGPRFRLTAEQVRDSALAASGLLVEKIGGPSVKPYQPADLWAGDYYGNLKVYKVDEGEGLYRRSMYTFIKRTATPANLAIFDQPSREYCVIRRSRTNTPLQALDLMNDPTYLEASRVLAQRVMQDVKGEPAVRIAAAFKRVTSRAPGPKELAILVDGFQKGLARYKGDSAAAGKLLAVGKFPADTALDPAELAAYTLTASVIFNLDEAVTRQ